jgi:hypothetical protein
MRRRTSAVRLRALVPLACLGALLAACTSPSHGGTTTGRASVSPSPAGRTTSVPIDSLPGSQTQAWRDLDVTLVPPTGFAQDIHLTQPVINHTGGRVDDATAKRWAVDYLRAGTWEKWGTENLQLNGFFNHLAPADSITQGNVFGDNYGVMRKAKAASRGVQVQNLTIARFTLVAVPTDVKGALTGTFSYPSPIPDYALVIDQQGPAGAWTTDSGGQRDPYQTVPAAFRDTTFVVGEARALPGTLGDIWYVHTYLGCGNNSFLRAACTA